MHALGFQHEHQRPDRDNYIEVQTENVLFDYRYQFEVIYNDWSPYNKGKLLVVEKLFETLKITIHTY